MIIILIIIIKHNNRKQKRRLVTSSQILDYTTDRYRAGCGKKKKGCREPRSRIVQYDAADANHTDRGVSRPHRVRLPDPRDDTDADDAVLWSRKRRGQQAEGDRSSLLQHCFGRSTEASCRAAGACCTWKA